MSRRIYFGEPPTREQRIEAEMEAADRWHDERIEREERQREERATRQGED